ncbi:MAG: hypothetical protein ACK5KR_05505 [Breznakia sp.]
MPNIISHTIFIEDVIEDIKDEQLKQLFKKYPNEYLIGTNGPDFLFFHDVFPLWKKTNTSIAKFGTRLHREAIHAFYESALTTYQKQEDTAQKEAMKVYVLAHYLHWQLDSVMHPYVVYFSGFGKPYSASHHHRLESMMDTINLKRFRKKSVKRYKTYENCRLGRYSERVITLVYQDAIRACFDEDIKAKDISKALADWRKVQRYLHDPSGFKFRLLQGLEMLARKQWELSGNIVRTKIDHYDEVLNTNRIAWKHPVSGEVYNDTHDDRFIFAKREAKKGLALWNAALSSNDISAFLEFLDHKTYANGIKGSQKRLYKCDIYEKK